MDNLSVNALKRARASRGITQEKAAEMSGYSVDAIQAWEAGRRQAAVDVLDTLAICYETPWLVGMYLREQSRGSIAQTLPAFEPGVPLPQAVMALLDKIWAFNERNGDRHLISMAADGTIDETERPEFDRIMGDLEDICRMAMELKFARQEE